MLFDIRSFAISQRGEKTGANMADSDLNCAISHNLHVSSESSPIDLDDADAIDKVLDVVAIEVERERRRTDAEERNECKRKRQRGYEKEYRHRKQVRTCS